MIPLLLILLFSNFGLSCKEDTTDCERRTIVDETKLTISNVIADIKESLKESKDFFVKYETDLHSFSVQLESKLRTDTIMFERLLELQERHGSLFATSYDFYDLCGPKECFSEFGRIDDFEWSEKNVVMSALVVNKSNIVCPTMAGRSSAPLLLNYKDENGTITLGGDRFDCSNGTWIKSDKKISSQSEIIDATSVMCAIEKNEVCQSIIRSVRNCENCTTPDYFPKTWMYTCPKDYAFNVTEETRQVRCKFDGNRVELVYEGNGTSGNFDGDLMCHPIENKNPCPYSCSETAECNKEKLVCVCLEGYVDISRQFDKEPGSICTKCNNSDPLGTDYVMLYDLSASTKGNRSKMVDFISDFIQLIDIENSNNRFALVKFDYDAELVIPLELKENTTQLIARVEGIIDVEGWTNTPDALRVANEDVYAKLESESARPRVTILFTDGFPNDCFSQSQDHDDECITRDLQEETEKMRLTHKAQIIIVYIGRNEEEENIKHMRIIASEEEELSVEHFDDLKETVLDRLQYKIC